MNSEHVLKEGICGILIIVNCSLDCSIYDWVLVVHIPKIDGFKMPILAIRYCIATNKHPNP